jgi:hypothetical protein
MISNPFKWPPKKGPKHEERYRKFTYKPGKHLYHFDASSSEETGSGIPGWGHYMGFNVVFFANDENHAADILEDALRFRLSCDKNENTFGDAQVILDNKHKWKFTLAPTNQFYSVGWADNDTIL